MKRILVLFFVNLNFTVVFCISHDNLLTVNEIMASNIDCFFSPATNFDGWVELCNLSDKDIPLKSFYISDDEKNLKKWQCPEEMPVVPAKGYLVVWFDSNSINPCEPDFKLDVNGGHIYISDMSGNLIVSQDYPPAISRTSYARIGDGDFWGTTAFPSPGYENSNNGFYDGQLEEPIVSQQSQLFEGEMKIKVDFPKEAKLIYTLDGSKPDENNGYVSGNGLFSISETTNFRFRLYQYGKFPSNVVTRSFIKKEFDFTIPVISVVSDEKFLYDDSVGIMVKGVNEVSNWTMDWERPAHFSYIEEAEKKLCNIEQDVILNVAGGWSRRSDIKSIKLKGNKIFGSKNLDYPFFKDKPYIRNRTLLLRNGGNDRFRIKDAALETIIQRAGVDVDLQCYQPVMYYLNGKLIGVVNLREPNNKHYVYANYGLNEDEIDMYEPESSLLCGDSTAYNMWYELSKSVSDDLVYKEIMNIVDIDEYPTYLSSNLYLSLHDGWPRGNFKFFRPKDGRFRFISYDLDLPFWENDSPFRLMLDSDYYRDSIMFKDTEIFLNMLKNKDFRRRFIDDICIMGGAVFNPSHTNDILDFLANRVENMMKITNETPWPIIDEIKNKLAKQNEIIIEDLIGFGPLNLKNSNKVHAVISSDTEGCRLYVNESIIPYSDFDGTLFPPAVVKAIAPSGYRFMGWKSDGSGYVTKNPIAQIPDKDFSWQACFEMMSDDEKSISGIHPIMINEVSPANDSFINDYYKKEDWVELYNTTSKSIDLNGMFLSDDADNLGKYRISSDGLASTIIQPGGYVLIWCDKRKPISMLHAPFKLDADGGSVYLTSADGTYTDSLSYSSTRRNETVGRFPDGSVEGVYRMNVPTIGKANLYTSYSMIENSNSTAGTGKRINAEKGIDLRFDGQSLVVRTKEEDVEVKIYSVDGTMITRENIYVNGIEEVDLSFLPKGCYIGKAVCKDRRNAICKFIIM